MPSFVHKLPLSTWIGASVVALALCVPYAHAESVIWSDPQPSLKWTAQGFSATLNNPMVSVKYAASVSEVDAQGTIVRPIPCGSTVPVGTRLKYTFASHVSEDIYWYGTGSAMDSPYGDWSATEPPKLQRCSDKNLYASRVQARNLVDLHGSLAIATPQEKVTVSAGTCTASGSEQVCVMNTAGVANADFSFAPTTGQFWGGFWEYKYPNYVKPHCLINEGGTSDGPMYTEVTTTSSSSGCTGKNCSCTGKGCGGGSRTETSNVPFVLKVPAQNIMCRITVAATTGTPPTQPTVRGPNGGNCLAGTPYTLTFSATSPQSSQLRYGIDWNADGTVDQMVPPTGYVASGAEQTASRTFATPGAKTVRVFAQDDAGNVSPWSTYVFSCTGASTTAAFEGDNGQADIIGNGNGTGSGSVSPDLAIRAVPSLIHVGDTTKVSWSATNVTSCKVSAPNGDVWNTLTSDIGGNITSAIRSQTVYTLSCKDLNGNTVSKSAAVSILPSWQER